ncbi:hypothetical protein [Anaerostipes butyraticus]|uniref:Uncharacterized protein n=1 Tax=Anaerostipes butyraticus TaxID=645466 RepID=A0A916QDB9_9FIRM|nr:hypothetical protein [Anaerostipes butyraticus]GFO86474.1 hypothetical protein ANBU17_28210 [Anaerostipes butyraticus]
MNEIYRPFCEADYRSDRITKGNRKKAYKKIQIKEGSKKRLIIDLLREVGRPLSADESSLILYERGKVKTPHRQETAPRLSEMKDDGIVRAVDTDIYGHSLYELTEAWR